MWTEKDMIYLPPMIKLEYLKKIRVRWIILAIFLVAIWIVMGNPRLGEWYSRSIYPWVSGMLSRFSCLFPFYNTLNSSSFVTRNVVPCGR